MSVPAIGGHVFMQGGNILATGGVPNLISRALPVFTSTGTAANATSSNYQNIFFSTAMPTWVAIDISTVPAAQLTSNALYFYNEPDVQSQLYWDWNTHGAGGEQLDMPTAYTIEANTSAGGTGLAPTSGWVTLVTVAANLQCSRKHVLSGASALTGYNWVRMNISTTSGPDAGVKLKVDLWDIHLASRDIVFFGDSRTWFGTNHGYPDSSSTVSDSIGNQMQPYCGFYPPQIDAGNSGFNCANVASDIGGWLTALPGFKIAVINIGINDCTAQAWNAMWSTNFQTIVNAIIAAGCQCYCESIGYSTDSLPGDPAVYNTHIASIVSGTPGAFTGLDVYNLWKNNQSWIGGDGIHLLSTGWAAYRPFQAAFYGAVI